MMKHIHMKTMVLMFLLSFGSLCAQDGLDQKVTIPLSKPGSDGKLKIGLLYGSIIVKAHNKKDVIITTNNGKVQKSPKMRDGLRKIGDTSLEFSVEEFDNTVIVRSKKQNKKVDFTIMVPENFALNLRATNNGNITVEGVNGEMEISNLNGAITLKDIGGSVIADALNKNIKVTFTKGYQKSPMAFTSLNGNLDVTFPNNLKANIKAKTENGEIYTDFEMQMTNDVQKDKKRSSSGVYKVTVDKWVTGTINGGGEELLFKTMNGDIRIRSN